MKSERLASTTERYAPQALERPALAGEREIRRVEALEAIEGDRQRSLRQELAEAGPGGQGEPRSSELAQLAAHEVAEQLINLPDEARGQLTSPLLPDGFCVVDEKV
ncbi:MAG: hypothetical protein F9K30_03765 [Dechloromonas sp.]|nr:MAG: hypothetical protein F9K30_03765 [Dechloromonas sp.]